MCFFGKRLNSKKDARRKLVFILLFLFSINAFAKGSAEKYRVSSQYMEVKTAAGRAQPIYLIVEKGESFSLLKQRTDWFKIETESGDTGWVSEIDFFKAIGVSNYNLKTEVLSSKWELGVSGGVFGSEESYVVSSGYYFLPEILVSADFIKASGVYSSSTLATANLSLNLYRKYIVSPFINIATGFMKNTPRKILVNAHENTQLVYSYGGGFSVSAYKNMSVRITVRDYYLVDSKKNYYDWRVGVFSVFF